MRDIILLKGMCSESRDLFIFCEISDNISEMVQYSDIVAVGVYVGVRVCMWVCGGVHVEERQSVLRWRSRDSLSSRLDTMSTQLRSLFSTPLMKTQSGKYFSIQFNSIQCVKFTVRTQQRSKNAKQHNTGSGKM